MRVGELIEIARDAERYHVRDVVVHMSSGGPGIPSATWHITGVSDSLTYPDVELYADVEGDGMELWELISHLENFHDMAEVLVFTVDGDGEQTDNIYGITGAWVDADGPSEYGADDAYSCFLINLEF